MLYRSHVGRKHGDSNGLTVLRVLSSRLAAPLEGQPLSTRPHPPRGPGLGEAWSLSLPSPHILNLEG